MSEGRPPLHGYRGEAAGAGPGFPKGMAVCLSRQAGARGSGVARRLAARLGWQAYTQETLEYLAAEETAGGAFFQDVPKEARAWAEGRLGELARSGAVRHLPELGDLPRVLLSLAAGGGVVLVGRGAGFLLDPRTTLHARLVAPYGDRVAYTGQRLRLGEAEAARHVEQHDARREAFLARHFGFDPARPEPFDLVVNTGRLGEEGAARVLLEALEVKQPHAGESAGA